MADFDSETMLSFIEELTRRVQELKKELVDIGNQSGTGMRKAGDEVEKFGERIQRDTRGIHEMKEETGGLLGLIKGPVGLVGSLFAAAKAMEGFATSELRLRNFATNIGISAGAAAQLKLQLQASGFTAEEAAGKLGSIFSKLDNIKTFLSASPIYKQLAANDPAWANQILQAETLGNRMESLRLIQEKFARPGEPRSKTFLEGVLGIDAATREALNKNLTGLVMPRVFSPAESEKYIRDWLNVTQTIENNWQSSMHVMVGQTNEFIEATKREVRDLAEWWKTISKEMQKPENALTGPKGFLPSLEELKRIFPNAFPKSKEELGDGGDLPKGAKPTSFSGSELLDTEKDSNRLLSDIRDMMQRDRQITGAGGSGGGGGASGGGGSGPIFRPNVGGMGGTRGNRNNNRGNIKFGDFAKSMGATHADERGFAVFPTEAAGDAAHAALLKQPQYQNLTLDQFGNKYSEGSPAWKQTVGKALGIGLGDIVNTSDPRLLEGIRRAEGTSTSGRMDPMAPAGSRLLGADAATLVTSPSGRQFRVAKEFAPNFQGFINDYENAGGVIGPNSGGLAGRGNPSYHPLGRAIDVNQTGYGRRGGGVTLPQEIEDSLAKKWGLYPGSQFKSRSDIGHFEVRNAEIAAEARARMNQSMKGLNGNLGGASINVDFNNVPRGVKTNGDLMNEGVFKTLKINRSPQAPTTGGGVTDFNRFAFE